MGPRSNLWSQKKGKKSRDTVPLIETFLHLKKNSVAEHTLKAEVLPFVKNILKWLITVFVIEKKNTGKCCTKEPMKNDDIYCTFPSLSARYLHYDFTTNIYLLFSFYKHCISWIICLLSFWHFNILKMLSCSLYHTHLNSHNYSFFFLCQKQPFIFIKKDENNNNKMKMFVRLFLYQPQFLLKC